MAVALASCGHSPDSKPAGSITVQKQADTDSTTLLNTYNSKDKPGTKLRINPDSVELTALMRRAYEWHATKFRDYGFPLKFNAPSDSLFTGIDWAAYEKSYATYKKTNFFSDEFLAKHRAIAMTIDSSIKQAGVEWRNAKDGVPLWYTDSDDWCNCQDNPDFYWKRLTLNNLKFGDNTASFHWTWDEIDGVEPPLNYEVKAKKVNGTWKISYLQGLENYGTVANYKKIMKLSPQ
ncbi:hypothetical protein [Hymenobacter properus]|uniref:Uncharacterized protein n=1 Tax=Hymenobacter properus TaxID=2791026 RepID=A0A931FJV6_9BACT|nr:hypothetical protein [Hymenobacter properus]MBF9140985.1 hypothetical protein [Hymenobacter properus]MBR7719794.1 hypothetical protein [Microvirga sp. SRT04]